MNINQLRRDTPATDHLIHFNNAGAALMPTVVTDAVQEYQTYEARNGGYEAGAAFSEALAEVYTEGARLLHAKPHQIAVMNSATDGYSRALSSILWQQNDVILTTNDDYISNQFAFLSLQKRFGIRIVRADDYPEGGVKPDHLIDLARQLRPKLIAVTHVPTNAGRIQPVEAFGTVAREVGAWYLVDACQSVGQLDVNVEMIQADFLSFTGRKFLRGPRGTGLLYVSDRVLEDGLEPLFIDMRGADWTGPDTYLTQPSARRFEQWETAPALVLGLTAAIRYAKAIGLPAIADRNSLLAHRLQVGLGNLPGLRLLDTAEQTASLLLFTLPGQQPTALQTYLKANQVNFSMSFTNFALIDWERKGVEWAVRFSPHYYNTEAEIDTVVELLDAFLARKN